MVEVIVSFVICLIIFTISMRFILAVELNNNTKSGQQSIIMLNNATNFKLWELNTNPEKLLKEEGLKIETDTAQSMELQNMLLVTMKVKHKSGKLINQTSFYIKKQNTN